MTYTPAIVDEITLWRSIWFRAGADGIFYFFARLTLFCAAWIATAEYKDDPRMPGKRSLKIGRMRRTNLFGGSP